MEHDRSLDILEGIYTGKTDGSRECITCHYWFFLGVSFRFKPKVCDDYHDMTQKLIRFKDISVVTFEKDDYRIHFLGMSENE